MAQGVSDKGYKYLAIPLTGKWRPDTDATMLSEGDFEHLTNMRYKQTNVESIGGMTKVNTSALPKLQIKNIGQLLRDQPVESHILVQASNGSSSSVYSSSVVAPTQDNFSTTLWDDTAGAGIGRFSTSPDEGIVYCNGKDMSIYHGAESRCAAVVLASGDAKTIYADLTEFLTDGSQLYPLGFTTGGSNPYNVFIGATKPIDGVKFYVSTPNASPATLAAKYWANGMWNAMASGTDGTSVGGKTLAQTGIASFPSTVTLAKPVMLNNMYLYWYLFEFTGVDTTTKVSYITLSSPMQPVIDLWDGTPRIITSLIGRHGTGEFTDATLKVLKLDYAEGEPTSYADLDGFNTAGNSEMYIGGLERLTGINFFFGGNHGNTNAGTSYPTVKYWNGASWTTVTGLVDTMTKIDGSAYTNFYRSGSLFWEAPAEGLEFPSDPANLGVQYYYYKITVDVEMKDEFAGTGTATTVNGSTKVTGTGTQFLTELRVGSNLTNASGLYPNTVAMVVNNVSFFTATAAGTEAGTAGFRVRNAIPIDYITAVPAQKRLLPHKFSLQWQNRLVLCNDQGTGRNAAIIGGQNGTTIFNGQDSNTYYFGDRTDLMAGASLFSRFGSSLFENLILCKRNETWMVDGQKPDSYTLYKISATYGCVAPLSMAVCDVSYEVAEGVTKHIAIWLSATGVVMFDLNTVTPIDDDIDNYFDPLKPESINVAYAHLSVGWYDSRYKEYHIEIPSGAATTPDTELVYNLLKKKWSLNSRGSGNTITCGAKISGTNGSHYTYGGTDRGFVQRLEYGQTFDGTAITSRFKTKDIAFQGWMMETSVRKVKLLSRYKQVSTALASIQHYYDGILTPSTSADPVHTATIKSTTNRVVQSVKSMGSPFATFHSFDISVTVNNENIGFEPIGLGVLYKPIREEMI